VKSKITKEHLKMKDYHDGEFVTCTKQNKTKRVMRVEMSAYYI